MKNRKIKDINFELEKLEDTLLNTKSCMSLLNDFLIEIKQLKFEYQKLNNNIDLGSYYQLRLANIKEYHALGEIIEHEINQSAITIEIITDELRKL